MPSKQVEDAIKRARDIAEAGRTHGPRVAPALAKRWREAKVPHAPDAEAITALVAAQSALIESRCDAWLAADNALAAEQSDDAPYFAARDGATAAVREHLVRYRGLVDAACGATAVTEVGFAGNTPQDPDGLARLGRAVSKHVANKPPRVTAAGAKLDSAAALEGFDAKLDKLDKAIADVRREKREEQGARADRDRCETEFWRDVDSATAWLEAMFRQAGEPDLADRIAPPSRAPSTTPSAPNPPANQPAQ